MCEACQNREGKNKCKVCEGYFCDICTKTFYITQDLIYIEYDYEPRIEFVSESEILVDERINTYGAGAWATIGDFRRKKKMASYAKWVGCYKDLDFVLSCFDKLGLERIEIGPKKIEEFRNFKRTGYIPDVVRAI